MLIINKKMFLKFVSNFLKFFYPEEVFLRNFLRNAFSAHFSTGESFYSFLLMKSINDKKLKELINKNKLGNLVLTFDQKTKHAVFSSGLISELKKNNPVANLMMKSSRLNSDHVFKILTRGGCDFIVMKTYLFKNKLFEGKEVKVTSDLDIFINPNEFSKVYGLLAKNGFLYIPDARRMMESKIINDILFFRPSDQETFIKSGFIVEIHTSIIDEHNLAVLGSEYRKLSSGINSRLYTGTMFIRNHGVSLKVFKPTELFLSLFLHTFFQHNFEGPLAYYEAAIVLKKLKINWKHLNRFIKDFDLEVFFKWYLLIIDYLFPEALSKNVAAKVKKFKSSLSFGQSLLFLMLTYKMFRPTNFLKHQNKEILKGLLWAVISRTFLRFITRTAKTFLVRGFSFLIGHRV